MTTATHSKHRMILALALALPLGLAACGSDEGDGSDDPAAPSIPVGDRVPTESGALFNYLKNGDYKEFQAESMVHAPMNGSPHNMVRTYLNDTLIDSFAEGKSEHPVGSATIKELYQSDGATLNGWAVSVKTGASDSGDGWYWYEVLSTTDGSSPIVSSNGASLCTGCHASDVSGADYVRIEYPLL